VTSTLRIRQAERTGAGEAEWDAFVEAAPGGDLVQTSAWARSKRAVGLDARLVVVHDDRGRIAGGAHIVAKRIAPGVAAGSVARGPLARDAHAAEEVVARLVDEARAAGIRLLIAQPPAGGEDVERALAARGFETGCPTVAPEATILLDMTRADDELLADMSTMRRRNLRKRDLAALEITAEEDVELFARLHAATASRQGFTPLGVEALRAQWSALAPSGRCAMLIARYRGVAVSGIWLTSFRAVTTFKIAGWDAAASESVGAPRHANEALHWCAARWSRTWGSRLFDLGGLDRRTAELILAGDELPDDFRRTPAYFKQGFGGSLVLLPRARWTTVGAGAGSVRPALRRVLASDRARRAMARIRNG
jgi:hypothetical protein